MQESFKAETFVYSVYVTESDMRLTKIPAMCCFTGDSEYMYRLESPYFVSALTSVYLLKPNYMNVPLALRNGTVYYTANKVEAEKYAKTVLQTKIKAKKVEIEKLQSELQALQKSKTTF